MLCPLVYKKIVSSKNRIQKNFGPKRSRVKKFGSRNIWVQIYFKIFGNLKILYQFFLSNWSLDQKKFWIQKKSVQKFWVQNDLGPKKLGPKRFSLKKSKWKQIFSKEKLGLKNNLVQKYYINKEFKSKRFLAPLDLFLKFG